MKSTFNLILLLIVPVLWNCMFIQWCINTRDDAPLSQAQIPESTIAFLDSLGSRLMGDDDHLILRWVDSLDFDSWNNRNDYGQDSLYVYEADSLFIIYSDRDDKELMEKVRQYACNAVRPLEQLMGHYVYPSELNGRKLPLYLCSDTDNYQKVCCELAGDDDYSKTWGLCIYSYSGVDVQTRGITLNYGSMRKLSMSPEVDLNATIWHEMNHYVYFQSIDLSTELWMHTWLYEGLAEYFSSQIKKQTTALSSQEKSAADRNHLNSSFTPFMFNYSGGEIFYDYLEEAYGKDGVSRFVQGIYDKPVPEVLKMFDSDVSLAERGWRNYIKENYI